VARPNRGGLIGEPHVVDHDRQAAVKKLRRCPAPGAGPEFGADQFPAPFRPERLHGVARRLAAEQLAGPFLQRPVDLIFGKAERAHHRLERPREAHARIAIGLGEIIGRIGLAGTSLAAKADQPGAHLARLRQHGVKIESIAAHGVRPL
jgi:hypothetical protein